ncbi:MAG: hypothetical protein R3B99_07060 [Polyangiales bacterium]
MSDEPPTKPAALGRWEPPPGSVTWDSGWSVDPRRAAGGYALALVVVGAVSAGLTALVVDHASPPISASLADFARAQRHAASAWWTVSTALAGLMTLGTTKRCFAFGRGTWVGAPLGVALSVGAAFVPLDTRGWLPTVLVGLVTSTLGRAFAVDERRRYVAAFAWATTAFFLLDVVRERFGVDGLDTSASIRLVARGGLAVGAAWAGALALAGTRRSGPPT